MSLINDALKRARQSIQRKRSSPAPGEGAGGMTPLQPVYGATSNSGGFDWAFVKLGLLALLVIGGIGYKVWPYLHKRTQVQASAIPARSITNQSNAAALQSNPATNNNPIARAKRTFDKVHDLHAEGEANYSMVDAKPAPAAVVAATTEVLPKVENGPRLENTPAVAKASANPETAVTHKLQAVFFREVNPSALINGKSVGVGEEIDGVKVKSIAPQSVILDYPAGPKELSLR